MSVAHPDRLLTPDEGAPAECLNDSGTGGVVLVCEHASAFVPAALDGLGVAERDRLSHAAWDPGALDVARAMSRELDAPLVASRVSRLVFDCNRPPEAPDAMPARSEVIDVPGNRELTDADRAERTRAVHDPFRDLLSQTLKARPGAALVTVHSFTPVWHGQPREAEIGFLHDADPTLANAMLEGAADLPARAALNVPYAAADGVTHTLRAHGAGRPNVMIEIRNDLIATPRQAEEVGRALARLCVRALAQGATA